MRTLLLVIVMVLLALAAGLSFVLPAAAQREPSAELAFGCGDTVLASQETVLISCDAVARNTGTVRLSGPQLQFIPAAAVPPPDFYLFWSATHDGVRSTPGEVQLTYDFGDIEPGESSVIELEIIVRSTHDYGADVALVAEPDQHEYSRTTIRGAVTPEGAATVPATLTRVAGHASPPLAEGTYRLAIINFGATPYDDVAVELSPGDGIGVEGAPDWKPAGDAGRLVADFGSLPGSATIERTFTLAPASADCTEARPVLVVTTTQGVVVRRQPLVDDGVLLNFCGGGEPDPDGVTLPHGGFGPSASAGRAHWPETTLAAAGALCAAMGATARRRPSRRRRSG
ncbi:MAG: hypothetical protein HY874_01610 [Chloroflexi bacterium]|nr:hypothetical protein [Chloroflexota bacterium]